MRCLLLVLSTLLLSGVAQGFPETVRHGYVNCGVCHVSLSGGGTLTPYGRNLAGEFMATWSKENEGAPLHDTVKKLPENLLVGGGFRSVQTYTDTPKFTQGRYFMMQADLDLGWSTESFAFDASYGLDINSPETGDDDKWVSARHYVVANINENFSVRAGKFVKNYGLNIPNHTVQIKRGLGWDEGTETYNAEFNYVTENYVLNFTGIAGRPDDDKVDSEKGFAISAQWLHLKPSFRVGASYFSGRASDDTDREIFGPNFIWGVSQRVYLTGEYDWVRVAPATGELIEGYVTYNKVGCEIFRGFDLTLTHEMKKNDRKENELTFQGYGPGLVWQPRPHFMLMGEWQKQKTTQYDGKWIDSAFFMAQYWF